MNKSEIAERAARFYQENATNVVNVPRPGHPEDKSGWDGVRQASEARFIAQDALVMTLADAFDFAAKFAERAIAESQAPKPESQQYIPPQDGKDPKNQRDYYPMGRQWNAELGDGEPSPSPNNLAKEVKQSLLRKAAEWDEKDWESATKFARHAVNAVLDLVAAEAEINRLRRQK